MEILSVNFRTRTPAMSNIILAALWLSVSRYLSERNTTSVMPDWMIALAHSLHGNRVVYSVQPQRSALLRLRMAFSSAWHTNGYLVCRGEPSRPQGSSSSEQPVGKPE